MRPSIICPINPVLGHVECQGRDGACGAPSTKVRIYTDDQRPQNIPVCDRCADEPEE